MRYALLSIAMLVAPQLFAQPPAPNWNWTALNAGCFVENPNGTPATPCFAYWNNYSQYHIAIGHCTGSCDTHPVFGLTCKLARSMEEELAGPDLNASTPSVMAPPDPSVDPGNDVRQRMLKCVELNDCLCQFQPSNVYLCIADPASTTYESRGTYQGDLNGPACANPVPPNQGGGGFEP